MPSSILIKYLPPYIKKWIGLLMSEYYNRHSRLASTCPWSNLSPVFGPSMNKRSEQLATQEAASYILFSAKTQIYKQNTYAKWSWKVFISIYFVFLFSAKTRIYKQNKHTRTQSGAENALFQFCLTITEPRFLLSIPRKWKTIEVSAFHAPLVS